MNVDQQVSAANFGAALNPEVIEKMKALIFATKAQDDESNLLVSTPDEEQREELISIGKAWTKWCLTVSQN